MNQVNLKGVMYAFGTQADITAASGSYVLGRLYVVTNDGTPTGTATKIGEAISSTQINWHVSQAQLDAVIADVATNAAGLAAEIVRATAAEGVNAAAIAQEVADRQTAVATEATARAAGDATNASAVSAEATARAAADTTLTNDLAAEVTARTNADSALAAAAVTEHNARVAVESALTEAIGNEQTDRIAADAVLQAQIDGMDTAYKAADSALNTSLTNALNTAVANLRDTTVADLIPVVYTADQSSTLASLLGSGRPDGIYAFAFSSDDVSKVMTVTGLPVGTGVGTGDITFGDILRVVVDGGVVTTAEKIDDLTKQKFASLDTSISALEAATTVNAIRSNFSATGWATLTNGVINVAKSTQLGNNIVDGTDGKAYLSVQGTSIRYTKDGGIFDATVTSTVSDIYSQLESITSGLVQADNGLTIEDGKVGIGGALRKNTVVSGAFDLKLSNASTTVDGVFKLPIWSTNGDGSKNAKGSTFAEIWFDGSGMNVVLPNS